MWKLCLLILLAGTALAGEQVVREFSWTELKDQGQLRGGELDAADGAGRTLKVEHPEAQAAEVLVFNMGGAGLTEANYALRGEVRCENVEGQAYLKLESVFPGFANRSSTTQAESGPRGALRDSAPWRPFVLPFDPGRLEPDSFHLPVDPARLAPISLHFSVVFPGRGTVYLRAVRLVRDAPRSPAAPAEGVPAPSTRPLPLEPGAWWGLKITGILGASLAIFLLVCFGVLGVVMVRKRARRFTFAMLKALIGGGGVLLVMAAAALVMQQDFLLVYSLVLNGVLWVALPLAVLRPVRRRYEKGEKT